MGRKRKNVKPWNFGHGGRGRQRQGAPPANPLHNQPNQGPMSEPVQPPGQGPVSGQIEQGQLAAPEARPVGCTFIPQLQEVTFPAFGQREPAFADPAALKALAAAVGEGATVGSLMKLCENQGLEPVAGPSGCNVIDGVTSSQSTATPGRAGLGAITNSVPCNQETNAVSSTYDKINDEGRKAKGNTNTSNTHQLCNHNVVMHTSPKKHTSHGPPGTDLGDHSTMKVLTESGAVQQLFTMIKKLQPDVADQVNSIQEALAIGPPSVSHRVMNASYTTNTFTSSATSSSFHNVSLSRNMSLSSNTLLSQQSSVPVKKKKKKRKPRSQRGKGKLMLKKRPDKRSKDAHSNLRLSQSLRLRRKERYLAPRSSERQEEGSKHEKRKRSVSPGLGKNKEKSSPIDGRRSRSPIQRHGKAKVKSTTETCEREPASSPSKWRSKERSYSSTLGGREHSPSPKRRRNEMSCSPVYRDRKINESSRSPVYRDRQKSERSCSPVYRDRQRSERSCSPVYRNKRINERSCSPVCSDRHRSERSWSPVYKDRQRSERSCSPLYRDKRRSERSYSPPYKDRQRSESSYSPVHRDRHRSERSCSPICRGERRNRRSSSPVYKDRQRSERSCSPVHRDRHRSKRSCSLVCRGKRRNRRSCSPVYKDRQRSERSCSPVYRDRHRSKGSCSPVCRCESKNGRSCSPVNKDRQRSERSCSPLHRDRHRRERSCSPVYRGERRNGRSSSPVYKDRQRSERSCSPVHRDRHRSERSCSPVCRGERRNGRSCSPVYKDRLRSERSCSPVYRDRHRRERSCSPVYRGERRNRRSSSLVYKDREGSDRSCSPVNRNRHRSERSCSPVCRGKQRSGRSCSPVYKDRQRSERSCSPVYRDRRRSERSCSYVDRDGQRRESSFSSVDKDRRLSEWSYSSVSSNGWGSERSYSPVYSDRRGRSISPNHKRKRGRLGSAKTGDRHTRSPSPCSSGSGSCSFSPARRGKKRSPMFGRTKEDYPQIGKKYKEDDDQKKQRDGWESMKTKIEAQLRNMPGLETGMATGSYVLPHSSVYTSATSQGEQTCFTNLNNAYPDPSGLPGYTSQRQSVNASSATGTFCNISVAYGSALMWNTEYHEVNHVGMGSSSSFWPERSLSLQAVGGMCMDGPGQQGTSQDLGQTCTYDNVDKVNGNAAASSQPGVYHIPVVTGASQRECNSTSNQHQGEGKLAIETVAPNVKENTISNQHQGSSTAIEKGLEKVKGESEVDRTDEDPNDDVNSNLSDSSYKASINKHDNELRNHESNQQTPSLDKVALPRVSINDSSQSGFALESFLTDSQDTPRPTSSNSVDQPLCARAIGKSTTKDQDIPLTSDTFLPSTDSHPERAPAVVKNKCHDTCGSCPSVTEIDCAVSDGDNNDRNVKIGCMANHASSHLHDNTIFDGKTEFHKKKDDQQNLFRTSNIDKLYCDDKNPNNTTDNGSPSFGKGKDLSGFIRLPSHQTVLRDGPLKSDFIATHCQVSTPDPLSLIVTIKNDQLLDIIPNDMKIPNTQIDKRLGVSATNLKSKDALLGVVKNSYDVKSNVVLLDGDSIIGKTVQVACKDEKLSESVGRLEPMTGNGGSDLLCPRKTSCRNAIHLPPIIANNPDKAMSLVATTSSESLGSMSFDECPMLSGKNSAEKEESKQIKVELGCLPVVHSNQMLVGKTPKSSHPSSSLVSDAEFDVVAANNNLSEVSHEVESESCSDGCLVEDDRNINKEKVVDLVSSQEAALRLSDMAEKLQLVIDSLKSGLQSVPGVSPGNEGGDSFCKVEGRGEGDVGLVPEASEGVGFFHQCGQVVSSTCGGQEAVQDDKDSQVSAQTNRSSSFSESSKRLQGIEMASSIEHSKPRNSVDDKESQSCAPITVGSSLSESSKQLQAIDVASSIEHSKTAKSLDNTESQSSTQTYVNCLLSESSEQLYAIDAASSIEHSKPEKSVDDASVRESHKQTKSVNRHSSMETPQQQVPADATQTHLNFKPRKAVRADSSHISSDPRQLEDGVSKLQNPELRIDHPSICTDDEALSSRSLLLGDKVSAPFIEHGNGTEADHDTSKVESSSRVPIKDGLISGPELYRLGQKVHEIVSSSITPDCNTPMEVLDMQAHADEDAHLSSGSESAVSCDEVDGLSGDNRPEQFDDDEPAIRVNDRNLDNSLQSPGTNADHSLPSSAPPDGSIHNLSDVVDSCFPVRGTPDMPDIIPNQYPPKLAKSRPPLLPTPGAVMYGQPDSDYLVAPNSDHTQFINEHDADAKPDRHQPRHSPPLAHVSKSRPPLLPTPGAEDTMQHLSTLYSYHTQYLRSALARYMTSKSGRFQSAPANGPLLPSHDSLSCEESGVLDHCLPDETDLHALDADRDNLIPHHDEFTPTGPRSRADDDDFNDDVHSDMNQGRFPDNSNPDVPFDPHCRPKAAMVWRSRFPRGHSNQGQFSLPGQTFLAPTYQWQRFSQNQRCSRWPGPLQAGNSLNQVPSVRFAGEDVNSRLGQRWPSLEQRHWTQSHPYRSLRPNLVPRNKPYPPAPRPVLARPQVRPVRWPASVNVRSSVAAPQNPEWGCPRSVSSSPTSHQRSLSNDGDQPARLVKRRHTEGSDAVTSPAAKRHESCSGGMPQHRTGDESLERVSPQRPFIQQNSPGVRRNLVQIPLQPASSDNLLPTPHLKSDVPTKESNDSLSPQSLRPPMNASGRHGLFGPLKKAASSPQKAVSSYATPPRKTPPYQGQSYSPSLKEKLGEIVKECLDSSSSPQRAGARATMTSPRSGGSAAADRDSNAVDRLSALSVNDNENLKNSKDVDGAVLHNSPSKNEPSDSVGSTAYKATASVDDELDPVLERLTLERPSGHKHSPTCDTSGKTLEMILREQDLRRAQNAEKSQSQQVSLEQEEGNDDAADFDVPNAMVGSPSLSMDTEDSMLMNSEEKDLFASDEEDDDLADVPLGFSCAAESSTRLPSTVTTSLQALLQDHQAKQELERKRIEIQEMRCQLSLDGNVFDCPEILAEGDDMLPEHAEQLRKLGITEQTISYSHPGELVFRPQRYLGLFSEALTLSQCGYTGAKTAIDKQLTTLPQESLVEFVNADLIILCFEKISHPEEFLNWAFLMLSVHRNSLFLESLHKILYYILENDRGKGAKWVPSLLQVCRVAVNYGADLHTLCPDKEWVRFQEEDLRVIENQENFAPANAAQGNQTGFRCQNLKFIIDVINNAVLFKSSCYSEEDLMALVVIVCNMALDDKLTYDSMGNRIDSILSVLLVAFSEETWKERVHSLCHVLPWLSEHHHNMVYLSQLFPGTPRGTYMKKRLCYVLLQQLVFSDTKQQDLENMAVSRVAPILEEIDTSSSDYYRISSVISLVDGCIGNNVLRSSERDDLAKLLEMVKSLNGGIKENIGVMDRSVVKDILTRMTTKWTFLMQDMASKQSSLYAWSHSAAPVIQQLSCGDEDEDEEELGDNLESDKLDC